jgi:phenylpropionate dioxygenase-like ring-hydroxylating dioxygenase large terminal subunit
MRIGEIVGWPYKTYPSGWFQLAWSEEVERGQIVRRYYWDRELILWRGESGRVYVTSAHEPRRGLHLATCGRVVGETIENTVDGWRWRSDGTPEPPPGQHSADGAQLRTLPAEEYLGFVLAWYDAAGEAPTWPVTTIEAFNDADFYPAWPHGKTTEPMAAQPQLFAENVADIVHVKYAHRWVNIPEFTHWEEHGPALIVGYEGDFPSRRGPVHAVFENRAWGLGVLRTEMTSLRQFFHFLCTTPVDRTRIDIRLSAWVQRAEGDTSDTPDKVAQAIIRAQHAEVLGPEVDRTIWENQAYLAKGAFRREEVKYVSMRKWSDQFYPHEEALCR